MEVRILSTQLCSTETCWCWWCESYNTKLSTQLCSTETRPHSQKPWTRWAYFPHNSVLRKRQHQPHQSASRSIFPHNSVLRKHGWILLVRIRLLLCSFHTTLFYGNMDNGRTPMITISPFHTTLFYGNALHNLVWAIVDAYFPHNSVLRKLDIYIVILVDTVEKLFPHNSVLRKPWTFSVRSFKRLTTSVYLRVFPRSP